MKKLSFTIWIIVKSGKLVLYVNMYRTKSPKAWFLTCCFYIVITLTSCSAPDYFNQSWLSKIKTEDVTNWRLKVSNLKKILKGILEYNIEVRLFSHTLTIVIFYYFFLFFSVRLLSLIFVRLLWVSISRH